MSLSSTATSNNQLISTHLKIVYLQIWHLLNSHAELVLWTIFNKSRTNIFKSA